MSLQKAYGGVLSLIVALAICSPLFEDCRGARGDNFPLSWYPMFARPRPPEEQVTSVMGFTAQGERFVIGSRFYSRGSMNAARRQIMSLGRRPEGRETCQLIAEKIAKLKKGPLTDVVEVRIVRGTYDPKAYFQQGEHAPMRERVYHRCRVTRGGAP